MSQIIGIDGCKRGWFSVWQNPDDTIQSSIFSTLNHLKDFFNDEAHLIIGIDMPVVLSDFIP
ncbi:MAG TPA: hypothetical protein DD612_01065, partial [Methylophilaceae bacterium]|nr:hypothetical protein [Methylophilaceae bacterium]